MVDQSTGLLSGLCGLGVVCSGILLVAAFVFIRLGGRGLLPLLSLVLNRRSDKTTPTITLPPRRRVDLRARARSVDFDSALAAAQQSQVPPTPTGPAPDWTGSAPSEPWATERGRRPGNEDELYGGMLDLDGDGDPDL